jgi:hypothetical protein
MTTYQTNQSVPAGYYFDSNRWSIEPVAANGGLLPAGTWHRIPTALALVATPVLGLAFLVFLPFIGIALTVRAVLASSVDVVHGTAGDLAATMGPGWQTGEAHLTGSADHQAPAADAKPAADEKLTALEGEIERKRQGE